MTVEETQGRCRVTRKTVEAWIETGELPHYRLGPRTIRIASQDLEEFLEARRYAGLPPGLRSTPVEDKPPVDKKPSKRRASGGKPNMRSNSSSAVPAQKEPNSSPEPSSDEQTVAA